MKITMVVVLYKLKIFECKTINTLLQALRIEKRRANEIELILYDNSPEKQAFDPSVYDGLRISYVHDVRNLGVSAAYNYAWTAAKEAGSEWLLLFDHDTDVTEEYIHQLMNIHASKDKIAAVVPKIWYKDQMISPVYSNSLRPLKEDEPKVGIQNHPVMAINSGSLISMSFLNQIDGFTNEFPLDYLDHWLFYEIYAKGFKVFVLSATLKHELSVMDYNQVSFARYKSILNSEILFYKKYKNELLNAFRKQLMKRIGKQLLVVKNKKIALYTIKKLFTM
ncbi:glycosyltransferase [Bacillus sp. 03113]|uniref:glycosyltransferase n=1 Tax=Bacillus sp. 03113 TaxID=2578211 RepID=UPI00114422E5|nr:glycosyltransferase [Bacillus sp. 03113]